MQYIQYYDSPLGRITLASDGEKLSGLWFENQKYYGSTLSEERELKKPHAVGSAVSHNPISIIIPCHRVVGTNGSLTGYAGGIDKKVRLLTLEQADLSKLFVPTKGTAL